MNKYYLQVAQKLNSRSLRERAMIMLTFMAVCGFVWWNFYGLALLTQTRALNQQNKALAVDIKTLDQTTAAIQKRIDEGVHQSSLLKLKLLRQELINVKKMLKQQTSELIEPDEMFVLMQQLIFAESNLKLITMKRKSVDPAFTVEENAPQQAEIYRHVLLMSFQGNYKNVLEYLQKLEDLEWKLIWDRITLKTAEYPIIKVEIEISTMSDTKYWVGL